MILADVMEAISDRMATIDGLRCFGYPADNVSPPAAVVRYPDSIDFDQSYSRGLDEMSLSVVVVVGKVSDRASRDTISGYVAGSGANSVKSVLESGTYDDLYTIHVASVAFSIYTIAAVDYLAATFDIEITGNGD